MADRETIDGDGSSERETHDGSVSGAMLPPRNKTTGFKDHPREAEPYRNPVERIADFHEIYTEHDPLHLHTQSARCMDCGVPFCQSPDMIHGRSGCPIHNLIPEWNDLVFRGQWRDALDRLHKTNNFPEFTGRVCPAPCEGSCVLGITEQPVTIKNMEMAIIDRGFEEGWVVPVPPPTRTGKSVAVIGSGPAGLAAAAQLNKAGHRVVVYERADRIGGLLMYGIPNMKLDKGIVERRLELMRQEGVAFVVNANIGDGANGTRSVAELLDGVDALLLATGATVPNNLPIPGRDLDGVHFAMEFLTANTKRLLDSGYSHERGSPSRLREGAARSGAEDACIDAKDKNVIVIGGGDTGADCIGTALRHGCKTLANFEIVQPLPQDRAADNPWPTWPFVFRVDYAHQEAAARFNRDPRVYRTSAVAFQGDESGQLKALIAADFETVDGRFQKVEGSERAWDADLVLLAMGFRGPEHYVSEPLGLTLDARSNYQAEKGVYQTSNPKVFAAGDCRSGQSLVVRAINEGREAGREIDRFLIGETELP